MTTILANGENSCPLRNVTNYMGTLRKVKGVHPLMDKGFRLLWYICMGKVQLLGNLEGLLRRFGQLMMFCKQVRKVAMRSQKYSLKKSVFLLESDF